MALHKLVMEQEMRTREAKEMKNSYKESRQTMAIITKQQLEQNFRPFAKQTQLNNVIICNAQKNQ